MGFLREKNLFRFPENLKILKTCSYDPDIKNMSEHVLQSHQ